MESFYSMQISTHSLTAFITSSNNRPSEYLTLLQYLVHLRLISSSLSNSFNKSIASFFGIENFYKDKSLSMLL